MDNGGFGMQGKLQLELMFHKLIPEKEEYEKYYKQWIISVNIDYAAQKYTEFQKDKSLKKLIDDYNYFGYMVFDISLSRWYLIKNKISEEDKLREYNNFNKFRRWWHKEINKEIKNNIADLNNKINVFDKEIDILLEKINAAEQKLNKYRNIFYYSTNFNNVFDQRIKNRIFAQKHCSISWRSIKTVFKREFPTFQEYWDKFTNAVLTSFNKYDFEETVDRYRKQIGWVSK